MASSRCPIFQYWNPTANNNLFNCVISEWAPLPTQTWAVVGQVFRFRLLDHFYPGYIKPFANQQYVNHAAVAKSCLYSGVQTAPGHSVWVLFTCFNYSFPDCGRFAVLAVQKFCTFATQADTVVCAGQCWLSRVYRLVGDYVHDSRR